MCKFSVNDLVRIVKQTKSYSSVQGYVDNIQDHIDSKVILRITEIEDNGLDNLTIVLENKLDVYHEDMLELVWQI